LRACENDAKLAPIDGLAQEAGAHVADDRLTGRDALEGEARVLEAILSLGVHVEEEVSAICHVPALLHCFGEAAAWQVSHCVHSDKLRRFICSSTRPRAHNQEVASLVLAWQVQADGIDLGLRATFSEQDREVLWDVESLSEALFGTLRNDSELLAVRIHFHHTQASATPVEHLTVSRTKDFFRHAARTWTKVEDFTTSSLRWQRLHSKLLDRGTD